LQSDSLPFSDALTSEQIEQEFVAKGVSFGDAGCDANEALSEHLGTVYSMGVSLWAMLSQELLTDVQRSCRSAVQRVAVYYALLGVDVSSKNTGAYCRARAKVTEGVVRRLALTPFLSTALWFVAAASGGLLWLATPSRRRRRAKLVRARGDAPPRRAGEALGAAHPGDSPSPIGGHAVRR